MDEIVNDDNDENHEDHKHQTLGIVRWNWSADPSGRVTTVSSQFSAVLGAIASKNIIGNTFWGFCDGLSKPNIDWKELNDAFTEKKRIRKFVFSYMMQGRIVKFKLEGEPVFSKGVYVGHSGSGQECDHDEITTSDLSRNALSFALEGAGVGFGIFNAEGTLQEFTDRFHRHMVPAGVAISRNMTMATVMSYLKVRNTVKVLKEGTDSDIDERIIVSLRDRSSLFITRSPILEGGFVIKTEIINYIAREMRSITDANRRLKDENAVLVRRIEDYKNKLDNAIAGKMARGSSDTANDQSAGSDQLKRLVNFYENQIDVGILVTNLDGKPENANYVVAEMLGFKTAKDLLMSAEKISELKGYDVFRQDVTDEMLSESQPRLEREIELRSQYDTKVPVKEVITFYPSIVKPEKIISFIYEKTGDSYGDRETIRAEMKAEMKSQDVNIGTDFLENALGNIRTSVQVIAGYSDKDMVGYADEDAREENFAYIHKSCNTILNRIQDVANLYTAFSEDNQFAQNRFDPENVVHHICSAINIDVLNKDIDLVVELSDHDLDMICDEEILKTSLLRLVQNALDVAAFNSTITLRIKGDDLEKKLCFVISDESETSFEDMIRSTVDNKSEESHKILFNMKASKLLLEKMGFTLNVTSFSGLGNTIYINAPQETLVYKKVNDDDLAV